MTKNARRILLDEIKKDATILALAYSARLVVNEPNRAEAIRVRARDIADELIDGLLRHYTIRRRTRR